MTRHLGFLKATAISLSAGLCFREHGNTKKLGVYAWEKTAGELHGALPHSLSPQYRVQRDSLCFAGGLGVYVSHPST